MKVPIDGSMQSPWLTEAAFELSFPDNSATLNLLGGPSEAGTAKFAISEWIALIKPLPVGEHLIQIKDETPDSATPRARLKTSGGTGSTGTSRSSSDRAAGS